MGVRERVVKPATELAGCFTMNLLACLRRQNQPELITNILGRINGLAILVAASVWLQPTPAGAALATATFEVTARVVNSCKVTSQSLVTQAASGNETMTVTCGTGAEPANAQSDKGLMGSDSRSSSANIKYRISESPGTNGDVKIIMINF